MDALDLSGERRAILDGQEGGCFALFPGGFHVVRRAAGGDPVGEQRHLTQKVLPVALEIFNSVVAADFVGDEDGVKLGPAHFIRDRGEREHALRIVERVRVARGRVLPVGESIAVKVDQCCGVHDDFLSSRFVNMEKEEPEPLLFCV